MLPLSRGLLHLVLVFVVIVQLAIVDSSSACNLHGIIVPRHPPLYFDGGQSKGGKIYATCIDGIVLCFLDTREADKQADKVKCPDEPRVISPGHRRLSASTPSELNLWPQGFVCYDINRKMLNEAETRLILKAMRFIQKDSGTIRFITRETCKLGQAKGFLDATTCGGCDNYVDVTRYSASDGCYSTVSMVGGRQHVVLGPSCFDAPNALTERVSHGVPMHELLHSLSFLHEHQHPQNELELLVQNIPGGFEHNFKSRPNARLTRYDRYSIMHYGEYISGASMETKNHIMCDFKPQCPTLQTAAARKLRGVEPNKPKLRFCTLDITENCIKPREEFCRAFNPKIGQRVGLSCGDVQAIKQLYPYEKSQALELRLLEVERQTNSVNSADDPNESTGTFCSYAVEQAIPNDDCFDYSEFYGEYSM